MSTEAEYQLQEGSGAVRLSSLASSGNRSNSGSAEIDGPRATGLSSSLAAVDDPGSRLTVNPSGREDNERSLKTQDGCPEPENIGRKDSLSIEPTSDGQPTPNTCLITLLLPTSARHPYRLDEKYLARRNVATPQRTMDGKPDPFSISVYTLKELILREWREEWDAAPASPGSIRLIFFGKLLDDKLPLSEYNFSPDNSNIVHMTIRPPETDEDETAKATKSPGRSSETTGCSCCVIS